jgi:hypothetical protein
MPWSPPIGFRLGATLHEMPPLWPAAGLAIAALCAGGIRLWPGIALGTLAVMAPRGNGALLTAAIVASTTLEAVVGAVVLQRLASFRVDLRRARDACALIVVGGVVAPAVGATVGAAAFRLTASASVGRSATSGSPGSSATQWGDRLRAGGDPVASHGAPTGRASTDAGNALFVLGLALSSIDRASVPSRSSAERTDHSSSSAFRSSCGAPCDWASVRP